ELADEAARADRTGMFNCPHTGVALAALRKLVERKVIHSSERVVVLSTAHGLKFADQKAAYHMGTLEGIRPSHRNSPVELPADPPPPGGLPAAPGPGAPAHPRPGRAAGAARTRPNPRTPPPPRRREAPPPPPPADTPGPSTLAAHAGEPRLKPGHSVATPII